MLAWDHTYNTCFHGEIVDKCSRTEIPLFRIFTYSENLGDAERKFNGENMLNTEEFQEMDALFSVRLDVYAWVPPRQ